MPKTPEELEQDRLDAEAKAKADADAKVKEEADAKAKADVEAKEKADAEEFLKNLNLSDSKKEALKNDPELFEVFKHQVEAKRSANADAKKNREVAEKLKKEKQEADDNKKKEQGQYKELYEKSEADRKELETKQSRRLMEKDIQIEVVAQGLKPERKEAFNKIFDFTSLELDSEGSVIGLGEKIKTFKESYPEFFGETKQKPPGVHSDKPRITHGNTPLPDELQALRKKAQSGDPRAITLYTKKKKEFLASQK